MSDKKRNLGVKCNSENAVFEDCKNSSMLLSGRCTSTPIGTNRLSFSRLDTSISKLNISCADIRSTPKMDLSAVPIFGRKNLQLLNDYEKSGDQSGVVRILKKHDAKQRIVNVDQTFDDKAKASSSSLFNPKEESRDKTKRKILGNKRKSMHNDSRGPVFKTNSKRPKSPRLLTEMRAKLKVNREKIKNVIGEIVKENEKKTTAKQKNLKQMRPSLKTPSATVYNKYKITIPKSPKFGRTKSPCHV